MKAWMIITAITFLVALGSFFFKPKDLVWGKYLKRPNWLVFEPAIPIIWMAIFICGIASATMIWENDPGSLKTWLLMGCYLLLEIVTVAYIPIILRFRSLNLGAILGGAGVILGFLLLLAVSPISKLAALLLLPYGIWSVVGTYATEEMAEKNPDAA